MSELLEKSELSICDPQYQDLIKSILSWPDWKLQSFCLDQTDLRLLRTIKLEIPKEVTSYEKSSP